MQPPARPRSQRARTAAALALLCAAAGAALWPVLGAGFVYDDHLYLVGNPAVAAGLSRASVAWAFTSLHAANWHPLAWLSHLLDVTLFGMDPRAHHAVGLALHAANACVLFLVLRGATGACGRSLLVAALFAAHPLHVESAAWVSERKDLLATLFWFLAVGAWLRHARRPGPGPLAATAALFALALLAKPMPLTLPLLLLLLDAWPLGRVPLFRGFPGPAPREAWRRALLEKLPLLGLSLASAAVTLAAQGGGGALRAMERIPFGARLANALLSVVAYLRQAAWPAGLAAFYPHPGAGVSAFAATVAGAALAALCCLAALAARRRPHLAAGWGWFLVTLLPVLGLLQAGEQARADRYTYVPLTGVFVAVVWAAGEAAQGTGRRRTAVAAVAAAAAVAVLALAAAAGRQAAFWHDDVTLFGRALAVAPDNWVVRTNLGTTLSWSGRHDEALEQLRAAVALEPASSYAWYGLGTAHLRAGRFEEAERALRQALQLRPAHPETLLHLGESLARQGQLAAGEGALRRALALRPAFPDALLSLGLVAAARGDRRAADAAIREALRLDPGHAGARRAAAALGIVVDNRRTDP